MGRELLRNFQLATILKVRRNPRSPERVVSDFRLDAGSLRAPANHPVGVRLAQGEGSEPSGLRRHRSEKQALGIVLQPRNLFIRLEMLVQIMVSRDFVPFDALFVLGVPICACPE
jgi:hypothetical protein